MFIISGPAVAKWVGGRIPGSDGWQDFSGQNVKDLSFFFSFCVFFFFFCLQHWQNTFTKLLQWQVISHQSVTLPRASPPAQCELWSLAKGEWHLESTKSFFPLFVAAQCSMWDLSSPTKDWTCVPCRRSIETYPQVCQENPHMKYFDWEETWEETLGLRFPFTQFLGRTSD